MFGNDKMEDLERFRKCEAWGQVEDVGVGDFIGCEEYFQRCSGR